MAQTTPNTPFARVKAGFGSKNDLIEKIKGLVSDDLWTSRLNEKKSWDSISNAKLLRLYGVLNDVKQRFGSRDKLVDAVVNAQGRAKDGDYKKHFASWPLPRLLDALKSAENRTKKTEKKKASASAPKAAKPAVKAAPAAKKGAATAKAAPSAVKKGAAKAPTTAKKGTAAKKGAAKKS